MVTSSSLLLIAAAAAGRAAAATNENSGRGGGGGHSSSSSSSSSSNVRFLGFYSNGNAGQAAPGDAARESAVHANLFATANLTAIEAGFAQHQIAGMLTVSSVFLWHTDPVTGARAGGLRPGWHLHLQSMLAAAMPLVLKGGIRAFFLGDEVCCSQGVPGSNVSSVATIIRHALNQTASKAAADAIIYLNECSRAMHNNTRGYIGDMLPFAIDAISLDGQSAVDTLCVSACAACDVLCLPRLLTCLRSVPHPPQGTAPAHLTVAPAPSRNGN